MSRVDQVRLGFLIPPRWIAYLRWPGRWPVNAPIAGPFGNPSQKALILTNLGAERDHRQAFPEPSSILRSPRGADHTSDGLSWHGFGLSQYSLPVHDPSEAAPT